MPKINILNILSGDNQSTIVDKINYNFDQILSSGGGPQGQQGLIGATGPVGPQGVPGIQGAKGDKGNQWFVTANAPTNASLGDFWVDVDSPDQTILEYQSGGWVTTGYGLSSGDVFQKMNYIRSNGSLVDDKTAVVLGGIGSGQGSTAFTSLVLSDVPINTVGSVGGYAPGTPPEAFIRNVNQENSKLKITTDQRSNLISFSKGSLDLLSPGLNGANNPTISWDSPSTTLRPYDISFKNPTGGISILTEGTLRGPILMKSNSDSVRIESLGAGTFGGINILATKEVTVKSNADNISIFTGASTKGSFIRFNPNDGFSEFNDDITGAINANSPSLFVNSKGVGIGVGRKTNYTFKQTGADPRKLAVLGNVSISKQGFDHESVNMFIGAASTDTIDYDKGALLVRGYGAFGHNDPRYDLGSGLTTTGPSELANNFPKLFVAGSRRGQTFQVKTGSSSGFISRTTIGDGFNDYNAVTDKTSAGYGPDLTQEFFVDTYNFSAAPLISLQHKITNSTNVTDTATVFSISTFTKAGTYNPDTIATKTVIQTKNSNSELRLYANASSASTSIYNKVIIGARDKSLIGAFAGQDSSNVGTVTIGQNAISNRSTLYGVFDTARITFPSNDSNNHSLTVNGVQTIGTSDPYSAFSYINSASNYYGTDSSRPVGNVSMFKIQRGVLNSSNNASGYSYDNYANGLEIISYRTLNSNPITATNKSVGIIVATGTNKFTSPTTGFFVSDNGKNVGVNSVIDYGVGIKIGPTTDYQIGLQIGDRLWNTIFTTNTVLASVSPIAAYFNGKIYVDGDLDVGKYKSGRTLRIFEGSTDNDATTATRRYLAIAVSGDSYVINATYNTGATPQIRFQIGSSNIVYIDDKSIRGYNTGNATNPIYSFDDYKSNGMHSQYGTIALTQYGYNVLSLERTSTPGGTIRAYFPGDWKGSVDDGRRTEIAMKIFGSGTSGTGNTYGEFIYYQNGELRTTNSTSPGWNNAVDENFNYVDPYGGSLRILNLRRTGNGASTRYWNAGPIYIGAAPQFFSANALANGQDSSGAYRDVLCIHSDKRTHRLPNVAEGYYGIETTQVRARRIAVGTYLEGQIGGIGSNVKFYVTSAYEAGFLAAFKNYWDAHGVIINAGSGSGKQVLQIGNFDNTVGRWWNADNSTGATSDRKLKKNITYLEDGALDMINGLKPVFYNWKHSKDEDPKIIGLIAQDVQEVIPSLVQYNETVGSDGGSLSLNYEAINIYLLKAVQELSDKVKSLEAKLND